MQEGIRDLRCIRDSDCFRLAFQWPIGAEYVYIFRTENDYDENGKGDFDLSKGHLLTLQEYKCRGGYKLPKEPGIFTFHIQPYGDKITCQTGRVTVYGNVRRKLGFGAYTTHVLTLSSDHPVAGGVLCYAKHPPDGVVYSFYEPLSNTPLVRHIRTERHKEIKIFIADEKKRELYDLRI
jgi:hypothetical protein